jgi:hypothetical protein
MQCYGEDGAFGIAVWALYEERSGNLWAAAQSGLANEARSSKAISDTHGAHWSK